jgi:hypothetical protein
VPLDVVALELEDVDPFPLDEEVAVVVLPAPDASVPPEPLAGFTPSEPPQPAAAAKGTPSIASIIEAK